MTEPNFRLGKILQHQVLIFAYLIITGGGLLYPPAAQAQTELAINNISTNTDSYPENKVPRYNKLEITFDIDNSVAGNFQLPYDANPPNGIDLSYRKHQGISVDALFLPPGHDDWSQAYQQPAFFYAFFDDQVKRSWDGTDQGWYYPTGQTAWKVRFSPNKLGTWQFKLKAEDASGYSETDAQSFVVVDSPEKGFVQVSRVDPRYFEYDDGTLFLGLGFQNGANLDDPVLENEADYQKYQQNNIRLLRMWIGSMYGTAWNHYLGGRNKYDGYLPRSGVLPYYDTTTDRTSLTLRLDYELEGNVGWFDACRFQRWNDPEPVRQNTNYRVRIKYRGENITGPRNSSFPNYGLVAKIGGWHSNCHEPDTGTPVTNYGLNNDEWGYIEGIWNSGSNNFLPRLHLGLENVTEGKVNINAVSVQEDLGNGQYGPEIMIEPSMEYDLYYSQGSSYALDKVVELAEDHELYLKLVIMEKQDRIYAKLDDNGEFILAGADNLDGFYGVDRTLNKTRWLQRAWWRYLQARWGYSPNIHSWELTNEGDPGNGNHYALTDELGKFMHCQVFGITVGAGDSEKCTYDHPNDHMVTTSFWHSFPGKNFWANPKYPNVDYADVHAYVSTGWQNNPDHEIDAAQFHLDYSVDVRSNVDGYAAQSGISTKPIIRGETGIDYVDQQSEQPDLALDTEGVWLHNFIWSTLDSGALVELYWWGSNIESQPGPDGQSGLYEIYGNFFKFASTIPLNNGNYRNVAASTSNSNLRVVGQKDVINQRAHLWMQNKQHTWRNVVDGISISPYSGTVTISGFQADQDYSVFWVDPLDGERIIKKEIITTQATGDLDLTVNDLVSDVAVKIFLLANSTYLPAIIR